MSVLIHAHGFSLSDALKDACLSEVRHRLEPMLHGNLLARWNLYRDGREWIAFLSWHERRQHQGHVRIRSDDMYKSIHLAGKVAAEQMHEQHHKQNPRHRMAAKVAHQHAVEGDLQ